jgi:hypothetical protein
MCVAVRCEPAHSDAVVQLPPSDATNDQVRHRGPARPGHHHHSGKQSSHAFPAPTPLRPLNHPPPLLQSPGPTTAAFEVRPSDRGPSPSFGVRIPDGGMVGPAVPGPGGSMIGWAWQPRPEGSVHMEVVGFCGCAGTYGAAASTGPQVLSTKRSKPAFSFGGKGIVRSAMSPKATE